MKSRKPSLTSGIEKHIVSRIGFVPDDEVELYFKAADVLVLPYANISQSGVLFLGYGFGLPLIAADVGSLKEKIVLGKNRLRLPAVRRIPSGEDDQRVFCERLVPRP